MALKLGSTRGPQALVVYGLGLTLVFVSERLIGGQGSTRWVLSGLGSLAVVGGCGSFLLAWLGSADASRKVERLAFGLSLLGLISLALYGLSSDLVMGPTPVAQAPDGGPGLRQILMVAWPIGMICALLPLSFLQWSLASMGRGRGVEVGRVRASTAAAASLAMLLSSLFLINAIANEKDKSVDLSYFRTSSPSDASRALVEGLDQDTRALLFFPATNDVLAQVEPYFRQLAGLSVHFAVEQVDRAMDPALAERYRVNNEGTVVLERGGSNRKIELGDKLDTAKRKLRKLDQEFQEAFMKLSFKREVVYLISGHGERGQSKVEGDQRSRIGILKRGIEASNFTVKRLDAVGGLSQAVPDDAVALLWVGPVAALFPGENDSLRAYLDGGGRMLLLLDPEGEQQPAELLAHLGLEYQAVKLAHSEYYLPAGNTRTPADKYNLVTDKFSSHPAATTVSRFSRELPVAMPTVGSLDRAKGADQGNRITFLVRSLPNTWADVDGDAQRSKDEPLKVFQLAAAVSRKVTKPKPKLAQPDEGPKPASDPKAAPEADPKTGPDKAANTKPEPGSAKASKPSDVEPAEQETRVVVFADADLFADEWFKFRGNRYLLLDVLRWLLDEDRVTGAEQSEEDVPVQHTRGEDIWWFYSTVFAVPLLILGLGLFTGWGRGRKRRVSR
jgi:hypothetical protein